MAGIVGDMYDKTGHVFETLKENEKKEETVNALVAEFRAKEAYTDEMRDELTKFLMDCTRQQISPQSERRVMRLIRIISDLENMTDEIYHVSLLLERSVKKDQLFKDKEMKALAPYVGLVGDLLGFVQNHLGRPISPEEAELASIMETGIDQARNKLRKKSRRRIEAGENVKVELLFIDFVRRLEQLGDYCYSIANLLARLGD